MQLHYRKIGHGKPLIILHGLFGSADNWNTLAKEFSANYEVFVVDQRNHGLSPHDAEFSYEAMSNDLLELLNENNIEKANFIGHSMGGKVMMQFASEHSNRIDKMIVVDISPRYYKPHHQTVLQALHSVNFDVVTTRRQAEEILNPVLNDISTTQFLLKNIYWIDEIVDGVEVKKLAWRFNFKAISSQIENVGTESPKPSVQDAEKLNVLFIKGENSNYILEDDKRTIRNYYPNALIKTIANAGHWVQAEQPKEFYNSVIEFLK
jgi:pimeloyl-ACP methyl ester carboxylesterase